MNSDSEMAGRSNFLRDKFLVLKASSLKSSLSRDSSMEKRDVGVDVDVDLGENKLDLDDPDENSKTLRFGQLLLSS